MIENEENAAKEPLCLYATDTKRPWCNCPGVSCTEIECRNLARLKAILPDGEGRFDGANWHTKYRDEDAGDKASAPFVLVRSKYCCKQHCVDYEEGES